MVRTGHELIVWKGAKLATGKVIVDPPPFINSRAAYRRPEEFLKSRDNSWPPAIPAARAERHLDTRRVVLHPVVGSASR
jgi:hypothetical protein